MTLFFLLFDDDDDDDDDDDGFAEELFAKRFAPLFLIISKFERVDGSCLTWVREGSNN